MDGEGRWIGGAQAMTDYLKIAKEITRSHAQTSLALRKMVFEILNDCEIHRMNVWQTGDLLTGQILERFQVEVNHD